MNVLRKCIRYCRVGLRGANGLRTPNGELPAVTRAGTRGEAASQVRPFDLRAVTPGLRLASWLAGRTGYVWVDGWTGRFVLRLARVVAPHSRAAWRGPIDLEGARGVPPLSWFSVPVGGDIAQNFISAIDRVLAEDDAIGLTPQTATLMQSLLRTSFVCTGYASAGGEHRRPCISNPLHAMHTMHDSGRERPHVVLIDERARVRQPGTFSRTSPGSRREAFDRMVGAARTLHRDATFWLMRSTEPGSGRWLSSGCRVLPPDIRTLQWRATGAGCAAHAASHACVHAGTGVCPTFADHVYTVSAREGVYAVLAGANVHVFGDPYYAGWGLTQDHCPLPGRNARPTRAAFFHAVFVRLAHYLDPTTHQPGDFESVLASLALQDDVKLRFADLRHVVGVKFSWWKRPFVTPFLMAGGGSLRWAHNVQTLQRCASAALWGAQSAQALRADVRCVRIEDGFLHSAGLGSDIVAPHSQVMDRLGIYFDATGPSELTALLNEARFGAAELRRAAALRQTIVRLGLTKYNLGRRGPDWSAPTGRQVVLVPGQVADDASVRLGSGRITTCEILLREVRNRRPHAWLVYRPHPDVLSGNRRGLLNAGRVADVVDSSADIVSLIDVADEVHTLSSLAGFDALLRGKKVFTYGMPFYAGWGLTHDTIAEIPWRHRKLCLDMLTAGALLRYPVYWDWRLRLYTTPEAVVQRLAHGAARPMRPMRRTVARPVLRTLRWARNVALHLSWHVGQKLSRGQQTGSG